MSFILSPKTGKLIKTDSKAYQELVNDPEYKVFLFDTLNESTATLEPSGSPVIKSSLIPSPETSPVYFQKVVPVFSPPSPDNSLLDIPMPITNNKTCRSKF